MSTPVIPSWTLNAPVTSTKLQQMCDALSWLLAKPHGTFSQNTTAQPIPNNTATPVNWNEDVRKYKMTHSTSSNNSRITPTEEGVYWISALIEWAADAGAAGYRKVWGRKNGSSTLVEGSKIDSKVGTTVHSTLWTGQMYFNGTTDYLEIMVQQTSGGSLDLGFDEFNPRLNIEHATMLF